MSNVTATQIRELTEQLAVYHAQHAQRYGPMETCTQPTCVEVKEGIQWLKENLGREGATR